MHDDELAVPETNYRRLGIFALLGGVVITLLLMTDDASPSKNPPPAPKLITPSPSKQPPTIERVIQWPTTTLASIRDHDPFAIPETLLSKPTPNVPTEQNETSDISADTPETLELFDAQRVSAIIQTPTGASALIDGKIYREGDALNQKFRIISISQSGVVVQTDPTLSGPDGNKLERF